MRTAQIEIAGEQHSIGYGLRCLFLFEQIAGKPFELKTLADNYLYYFCCFVAVEPGFMGGDFARFIEACDDDPKLFTRISEALGSLTKAEGKMDGRSDGPADDKKKD